MVSRCCSCSTATTRMSDAKTREKIAKLRRLADHPNTPPHEAEAARGRIRALEGTPASRPTPTRTAEEMRKLARDVSRAARAGQTPYRPPADHNPFGRGVRDMFDEAIRADPRTTAQRNQDIRDRVWARETPSEAKARDDAERRREYDQAVREQAERDRQAARCKTPETFFTPGGIPRPRNTYRATCQKCGSTLERGEGAYMVVGGQSLVFCCEKVPGPRRRKRRD